VDVLSQSTPSARLTISLIITCGIAAEQLAFTAGSKQCWRMKGKAWMLGLVIRKLCLCCLCSYLLTIHLKTKWVQMAELAPGRLNRILQFKVAQNSFQHLDFDELL